MASTDHLQRKKHMLQVVAWLRENYKVGKSGSTSKNAVYQHYSDMCQERGIEPSINATYFGKLVKRAFPGVQYNRKGPRGNSLQHYTHLKRINHEKLKQQRLVEEASRAVETCGVPEEEALYRLMREKYAEMFAPLAAGLEAARVPPHHPHPAAGSLHPATAAAAAALLAADYGGHSPHYARSTRTGLLAADGSLHASSDARFRPASALHPPASDSDGATGSESPASGSPTLPPSSAISAGSRFLSSSLSIASPAPSSYSHQHQQAPPYLSHLTSSSGKPVAFPVGASAHYVVSSSPPSSPNGHPAYAHHRASVERSASPSPGHAHNAFTSSAFAYPPTCPYCHHCLHCYYSGGGGGVPPPAGPPQSAFHSGPPSSAYPPPPPPHHHPSVSGSTAPHLVTAKEASVLAQWVRERPFLPPIGPHGPSTLHIPTRVGDEAVTNTDDDDDDDADNDDNRDADHDNDAERSQHEADLQDPTRARTTTLPPAPGRRLVSQW